MKKLTKFETAVSKLGEPEDYIHLPVTKDGNAIGVINEAVEVEDGYKLSLLFFNSVEFEHVLENGKIKPYGINIK